LWVGTVDGLARLDVATGRFRTFRPDSTASTSVSALALSERGTVLVGTLGAGLLSLDPRTGRFTPVDIGPGLNATVVSSVHEDADGTVWVGTVGGGLRQLTPGVDGVVVHEASADDPAAIADDQVSDVMEDRQGVLWAATYNGLDRFDRASGTAVRLRHNPDDEATIASNEVLAVLPARDGTLYVGTDRSLDRSADGRTFSHTAIPIPTGTEPTAVRTLYQDRAGAVWAGTEGAGLHRVGPDGSLEKAPLQGQVGNLVVSAVFEDREGRFWVGTIGDGLLLYDRAAGTAEPLRNRPGQPASLASNDVRAIAQTTDGAVWVATIDGLCRMDRAEGGGAFTCPGPGNALVADELFALHAGREGELWVGGRSGLVHYDARGGATRYTSATTDLPGDAVFAITRDEADNLWLSTSGGLSQFDPVTEVFSNRLGEGAGAERTLGGAAARAADGRLYVGGTGGLLAFYPRQLATKNPNPPQVVITGVEVFGEPVVPGEDSPLDVAAPVAEALRLRYDQEYVTLRFAALHFSDPARNSYRFRLEGFDDTWRDAGQRREATYTNLDPGRYTFRVQAANADGVWGEVGASLGVVVRPPWWRTIWATLAFAGLAAVALVRAERGQKGRLLRQERERAQRRETELRAETAEAQQRKAEAEAERQRAETAMLLAENSRAAAEIESAREVREANAKLEAANTRLETSLVDLKATQTQLVQSEKLASLGQLTAGIAHEIKNPLNFVNNFADLSVDLAAELQQELEAGGARSVADLLPDLAPLLDDLRDNARRIHEHGQRAD
ncbi:MAG TPA: two-component regulator propeller domain-containing protein, partial [Rubricoccaceae bacterium]